MGSGMQTTSDTLSPWTVPTPSPNYVSVDIANLKLSKLISQRLARSRSDICIFFEVVRVLMLRRDFGDVETVMVLGFDYVDAQSDAEAIEAPKDSNSKYVSLRFPAMAEAMRQIEKRLSFGAVVSSWRTDVTAKESAAAADIDSWSANLFQLSRSWKRAYRRKSVGVKILMAYRFALGLNGDAKRSIETVFAFFVSVLLSTHSEVVELPLLSLDLPSTIANCTATRFGSSYLLTLPIAWPRQENSAEQQQRFATILKGDR